MSMAYQYLESLWPAFLCKERAVSNVSLFTGLVCTLLKSRCLGVLFVQFRNLRLEEWRAASANKIHGLILVAGEVAVLYPLFFNPLNAELNPICHLVVLLGAHHIFRVIRIRVKHSAFNFFFVSFCSDHSVWCAGVLISS